MVFTMWMFFSANPIFLTKKMKANKLEIKQVCPPYSWCFIVTLAETWFRLANQIWSLQYVDAETGDLRVIHCLLHKDQGCGKTDGIIKLAHSFLILAQVALPQDNPLWVVLWVFPKALPISCLFSSSNPFVKFLHGLINPFLLIRGFFLSTTETSNWYTAPKNPRSILHMPGCVQVTIRTIWKSTD